MGKRLAGKPADGPKRAEREDADPSPSAEPPAAEPPAENV